MPYTRWDMCTGKRERGERWKMERGRERGYRRGGGRMSISLEWYCSIIIYM